MTLDSAEQSQSTATALGPNLVLRGMAVLGVLLMVVNATWVSSTARPSSELIYAVIAAAAGLMVLFGPASRGARALFANPGLLVPYGCYEAGTAVLGWSTVAPATFRSRRR